MVGACSSVARGRLRPKVCRTRCAAREVSGEAVTLAKEIRLLADQVADLEIEARELKHEVFTLKNENEQLQKIAGASPAIGRQAGVASGVPEITPSRVPISAANSG